MTTVIKCDVCGKTAESSIDFASVEIDAYKLKSVIKDLHKEACSPACMAKLLRETADEMDPEGKPYVRCNVSGPKGYCDLPVHEGTTHSRKGNEWDEDGVEDEPESEPEKPGFFARLFK